MREKAGMKEESAWWAITLNPALREIAARPRFVMVDGKVVAKA